MFQTRSFRSQFQQNLYKYFSDKIIQKSLSLFSAASLSLRTGDKRIFKKSKIPSYHKSGKMFVSDKNYELDFIENSDVQARVPEYWWCLPSIWKPKRGPKTPVTNWPGEPHCSWHCRRRPCTHWSSQTLLQGASGAPYSLGGSLLFFLRSICYMPSIITISSQAVEKLLAAVNLPSKKAKLKQLKEIIARFFSISYNLTIY